MFGVAIRLLVCLFAVLTATPALAHASERGHVLLLPTGYYAVGGALAVAASFLALVAVRPGFLERAFRPRLETVGLPEVARLPVSLVSFAVMALLVAAGFLGSRDPLSNPLPLTVWTLLWVGLTLAQGLFGNLWAWINPWYGPQRAVSALLGRSADEPPLRLPEWLGCWPAVLLFFAFAWFELIYPAPDDPARLALAVGLYCLATFICMTVFGYEEWRRRGEFLSVFFGMVSRFGMVEAWRKHGRSRLRIGLPGAKLGEARPLPPGGVAFLLLALASVSFDGLSKTFFWLGANGINPLEFPGRTALMGVNSAGLLMTFAVLSAAYLGCVFAGERLARSRQRFGVSAGLMVWSLVPIALAYHFSHYLTALLVNAQYALGALSDPFGRGWDLFGTAGMHVSAGIAAGSDAAWAIWNAQAAAIVGGHVLAVAVAHLLAGRLHEDAKRAALSQIPLTALMVAYTVFGLWLLSTPTAG